MSEELRQEAVKLWKDYWPGDDYMLWPYNFSLVSFPMQFGSTAGPFGGIGGQAITTFQVDVLSDACRGKALVFANGRFWKAIDDFGFQCKVSSSRHGVKKVEAEEVDGRGLCTECPACYGRGGEHTCGRDKTDE